MPNSATINHEYTMGLPRPLNEREAPQWDLHPQTHKRLAPEVKAEMGITPSVLSLSVGLEHATDLIKDLTQALS